MERGLSAPCGYDGLLAGLPALVCGIEAGEFVGVLLIEAFRGFVPGLSKGIIRMWKKPDERPRDGNRDCRLLQLSAASRTRFSRRLAWKYEFMFYDRVHDFVAAEQVLDGWNSKECVERVRGCTLGGQGHQDV